MSESEGETEVVHYPTHVRRAFLEWASDGFPDTAIVEENYEPKTVPADELLRTFILPAGCTDVMPKQWCEAVAEHIGYHDDVGGMTYAVAATALLVSRAAGEDAAVRFLGRLFAADVEVR